MFFQKTLIQIRPRISLWSRDCIFQFRIPDSIPGSWHWKVSPRHVGTQRWNLETHKQQSHPKPIESIHDMIYIYREIYLIWIYHTKSTLHVLINPMDGMGLMIKDSRKLCFFVRNRGDGCYKIPNVPASIWPQTAGVDISSEWKSTTTIKTVVILELLSRNASLKLYLFKRPFVRWSLDPQGVFPRKCPEHSGLKV